MSKYLTRWMILASLLLLLPACGGSPAVDEPDVERGGLGQPCNLDGSCKKDFVCTDDVCTFPPLVDGDQDAEPEKEVEEEAGYECYRDTQCPPDHICEDHVCVEVIEDGDETVDGDTDDETVIDGPALQILPPAVNFGSLPVDQRSERDVFLANIGTERLSVESVTIPDGESQQGKFELAAPVSRFNLDPGDGITVTLRFRRLAEGPAEAWLVVGSDSILGAETSVRLFSDTWGRVALSLEPDDLNFGPIPVGQLGSVPATVTNALLGDDVSPLVIERVEFRQPGTVFSLGEGAPVFPRDIPPGQTAPLPLKAFPTQPGEARGTLLIYHNDPTKPYPLEAPLYAAGVIPNLMLDPGVLSFGPVPMGETRTALVAFRNTGGDTLIVEELLYSQISSSAFGHSLTDSEKPLGTLPAQIEVGEFALVPIVFAPDRFGEHAASLYVRSNDPVSETQIITLSGQAMPPDLSITPGFIDFECVQIGQTETRTVSISYRGEGSIGLQGALTTDGLLFPLQNLPQMPLTLNEGDTVEIEVAYAPRSRDAVDTGTLTLVIGGDEDTISYQIALSGCALSSVIGFTWDTNGAFQDVQRLPANLPDIRDMSPAELALWVERTPVTLFNQGNAPLHLSEIRTTDAATLVWGVDAIQPLTIAPDESSNFDILYAPRQVTNYTGRVVICSDAVNATGNPDLCATPGHAPVLIDIPRGAIEHELFVEPQSGLVSFGQPLPGESATATVTLHNMRPTTMHIEDIELQGSPEALDVFFIDSVVPARGADGWNLTGAQTITVNLRFTPQDGGSQNAALAIRHNDKDARKGSEAPGSAYPVYTVVLSGDGTDNTPPVAVIKSPPGEPADPLVGTRVTAVNPDTVITLSAATSYDVDDGDSIAGYQWSIQEETGFTWYTHPLTSATATISFEEAGIYHIALVVTDSRGGRSVPSPDARLEVRVQLDPVPIARERTTNQNNVTAYLRTPLLLDGSQSYDPDGQVVAWYWSWRWHDSAEAPALFSTETNPSITFTQTGLADILLDVVDNDGRRSPAPDPMLVLVRANDRIKIEAVWNNGGNVDLHYIRPGGTYGGSGDCNKNNRTPDWAAYGTPQFRTDSTNGVQPEVIVHDNPADGIYTLRADYVQVGQSCGYVKKCTHFDRNCNVCGCSCWNWLCGIDPNNCCKSCDTCVDEWVCNPLPAAITFYIYLNGAATPTWTVTGPTYVIEGSPGNVQFNLHRQNGAFLQP